MMTLTLTLSAGRLVNDGHHVAKAASTSGSASVTPTVVLAALAFIFSVASFIVSARRTRVDRQRAVFADALAEVMRYREFPFIVMRRDAGEPAKERQRISGDLSDVQANLNAYRARIRIEDTEVGRRYDELVEQTRQIAGGFIRDAWNAPAAADDAAVHSPGWDFSSLDRYDDAYVRAVADHLSWLPASLKRGVRG